MRRPSQSAAIPPRAPSEIIMSKHKNRGNREAKKPKREKPKVLTTANSGLGKPLNIGTPKAK